MKSELGNSNGERGLRGGGEGGVRTGGEKGRDRGGRRRRGGRREKEREQVGEGKRRRAMRGVGSSGEPQEGPAQCLPLEVTL